jgi:hypothetical protein
VELSESPTTGLTARILLPPDLLADESTLPPTPPRPTSAAWPKKPAHERVDAPSIPATRTETPTPAPTQQARTPNGLVKRQSRRRTQAAASTPATPTPRTPDRPSAPTNDPNSERSPSQVRSMLSAFQQGHQRGQLAMSGVGSAAQPKPGEPDSVAPVREEEPGDH